MSFSTSEFIGKKVFLTKEEVDNEIHVESFGRLHYFIFQNFHCVGFFIKLPDVAMMFSRRDVFCHISSFSFADKKILLDKDFKSKSRIALEEDDIDLKTSVVIDGQKVVTASGEEIGFIENVQIDDFGKIQTIDVGSGATSNVLLGTRQLPMNLLKGYKNLNQAKIMRRAGSTNESDAAVIVDDEASNIALVGGFAEVAAKKSVAITQTAKECGQKAKEASSPILKKRRVRLKKVERSHLISLKKAKRGLSDLLLNSKKNYSVINKSNGK